MTRIYSSDRDVRRAQYWRGFKADLLLVPFAAVVVFLIALVSADLAAIALVADIILWIGGRFSKSGFKMRFPAFLIAMSLNISAIVIAVKFF